MISVPDSVSAQPEALTLAAVLWMGLLASLNACAAVRLPILAAYVAGAGASRRRGLALAGLFTLGLVGGTVLLGLTATPLADGVHKALWVNKYLLWILGFGLVLAGFSISGLIDPQLLPEGWRRLGERLTKADLPGAVLLGIGLSLFHTPACPTCRAELLTVASSVSGPLLLVGFAVGQSLLALGLGVLVALLRPSLLLWLRTRMCSLEQRTRLLTGDMLMVLGIYLVVIG
jgi:thiol:disulfide interchange protein DsbD